MPSNEELLEIIEMRDITIQKYKDQQKVALHKDLLVDEITGLRKLVTRSYDMIGELIPGAGGLVVDIGELNSLMIGLRLAKNSSSPPDPVPSQKIFGG
jgi:hypothetical protein